MICDPTHNTPYAHLAGRLIHNYLRGAIIGDRGGLNSMPLVLVVEEPISFGYAEAYDSLPSSSVFQRQKLTGAQQAERSEFGNVLRFVTSSTPTWPRDQGSQAECLGRSTGTDCRPETGDRDRVAYLSRRCRWHQQCAYNDGLRPRVWRVEGDVQRRGRVVACNDQALSQ